jgi:hypothetical protein
MNRAYLLSCYDRTYLSRNEHSRKFFVEFVAVASDTVFHQTSHTVITRIKHWALYRSVIKPSAGLYHVPTELPHDGLVFDLILDVVRIAEHVLVVASIVINILIFRN